MRCSYATQNKFLYRLKIFIVGLFLYLNYAYEKEGLYFHISSKDIAIHIHYLYCINCNNWSCGLDTTKGKYLYDLQIIQILILYLGVY